MIWVPKFISNLRDVLISSPANNQVLTYETASGKWKNMAVSGGGKVAQVVTYNITSQVSGSGNIPLDATKPQNTEGNQLFTISITPTNINSKLLIFVKLNLTLSVFNVCIAALFKNSDVDAIATSQMNFSSGVGIPLTIQHSMIAGTISPITFKVRVGGNSGTITLNSNTYDFGETYDSSIIVTEVLP